MTDIVERLRDRECKFCDEAAAEIERQAEEIRCLIGERDENERLYLKLEEALRELEAWSHAYPLKVFPEPDFVLARTLLKAGGMSLDAISASNMRHVIEGIGKIAREALEP